MPQFLPIERLRLPVYAEFFEKLRGPREDNGLTQPQVAEVLGTSQTMYARYGRGTNELPIRHLVTLFRFYNISAGYLLGIQADKRRKRGTPTGGMGKKEPATKRPTAGGAPKI